MCVYIIQATLAEIEQEVQRLIINITPLYACVCVCVCMYVYISVGQTCRDPAAQQAQRPNGCSHYRARACSVRAPLALQKYKYWRNTANA